MSIFINDEEEVVSEAVDELIVNEAIDLGILNENGKFLNEARKGNYSTEIKKVKVTKEQKQKNLIQRTAMIMAQQKDDADYKAWRKFMDQASKMRIKIEKKYNSIAKKKAKEVIAGSKKVAKTDNMQTTKMT